MPNTYVLFFTVFSNVHRYGAAEIGRSLPDGAVVAAILQNRREVFVTPHLTAEDNEAITDFLLSADPHWTVEKRFKRY